MRHLIAAVMTMCVCGPALAGTPVRGVIYLQRCGQAGEVYRASFAYDGAGWLSLCEPVLVADLRHVKSLFAGPDGSHSYPRSTTGAPILLRDPRALRVIGTVESRLSYDSGEASVPSNGLLHVAMVDLGVPRDVFDPCREPAETPSELPPSTDPEGKSSPTHPNSGEWSATKSPKTQLMETGRFSKG